MSDNSTSKIRIYEIFHQIFGFLVTEGPIFLFGALGGGVSILIALSKYEPLLYSGSNGLAPEYSFSSCLIVLLIGAVVAFVGVNYFPGSDRSHKKRTLAFALVCGVGWQPLSEAFGAYFENISQQKNNRNIARKSKAVLDLNQNLNEEITSANISKSTNAIKDIIVAAKIIHDPAVKDGVYSVSSDTVNILAKSAKNSPDRELFNAGLDIASFADQMGEGAFARKTLSSFYAKNGNLTYNKNLFDAINASPLKETNKSLYYEAIVTSASKILEKTQKQGKIYNYHDLDNLKVSLTEAKKYYIDTGNQLSQIQVENILHELEKKRGKWIDK